MNVKLNLNLLKIFIVLMEKQSISKTADAVCLSQPAVSHALKKLREYFDDPLFIKKYSGVIPTPKSHELFDQIEPLMRNLSQVIETDPFDAATSNKTFTIGMSDYIASFMLPSLTSEVIHSAPFVTIKAEVLNRPEQSKWLEDYRVDCAIGVYDQRPKSSHYHEIYKEHVVCLAHENLFKGVRISMKQFLLYPHVLLDFREAYPRTIQTLLSEKELTRRVVLQTPHIASLGSILTQEKCLCVVPFKTAQVLLQDYPLKSYTMPISIPSFSVCLLWHASNNESDEINWLKNTIIKCIN